jgi:hypothetical protein
VRPASQDWFRLADHPNRNRAFTFYSGMRVLWGFSDLFCS